MIISTKEQSKDPSSRLLDANRRQHLGTSISCKIDDEKNIEIIKQKNYDIQAIIKKIGESRLLILTAYMPTSVKRQNSTLCAMRSAQ